MEHLIRVDAAETALKDRVHKKRLESGLREENKKIRASQAAISHIELFRYR